MFSLFKYSTESDNHSEDESNTKKGGCDVNVDQKGRDPPGLHIAVFHHKRGVVLPPAITRYGTSRPTVTKAQALALRTVIDFCGTPELDRF